MRPRRVRPPPLPGRQLRSRQEGVPQGPDQDHHRPRPAYAAQASPHNWKDLIEKSKKGIDTPGPAFINVISPCPRGWRHDGSQTIAMSKLAVETCVWPLYEYENGEWRLTGESLRIAECSSEKKPVSEWLSSQGSFKHLMKGKFTSVADEIQANVDKKWEQLKKLSKM